MEEIYFFIDKENKIVGNHLKLYFYYINKE